MRPFGDLFKMHHARRNDRDRVDIRLLQHFIIIRIGICYAELFAGARKLRFDRRAGRSELYAGNAKRQIRRMHAASRPNPAMPILMGPTAFPPRYPPATQTLPRRSLSTQA